MKTESNNIISNWLKENGDPAIKKLTEMNLAIATKINDVLVKKKLKPVDLANLLGKSPSEISKWLTGTHTFTTKTLAKISLALEDEIIHTEPQIRNVYFTAYVSADFDDTKYESSEVFTPTLETTQKVS